MASQGAETVELADGTKFASETLLMTNIESRPWTHPATGVTVWDITYYMLVNTAGPDIVQGDGKIPTWNQIMNRKGTYTNIVDERGNPPFAKVDFKTEMWPDASA